MKHHPIVRHCASSRQGRARLLKPITTGFRQPVAVAGQAAHHPPAARDDLGAEPLNIRLASQKHVLSCAHNIDALRTGLRKGILIVEQALSDAAATGKNARTDTPHIARTVSTRAAYEREGWTGQRVELTLGGAGGSRRHHPGDGKPGDDDGQSDPEICKKRHLNCPILSQLDPC